MTQSAQGLSDKHESLGLVSGTHIKKVRPADMRLENQGWRGESWSPGWLLTDYGVSSK